MWVCRGLGRGKGHVFRVLGAARVMEEPFRDGN